MMMKRAERIRVSERVVVCGITLIAVTAALAFQVKQEGGRFEALVIPDPSAISGVATMPDDALGAQDPLRTGWNAFRASHGQQWRVWLDRRSGGPMLVEGRGVPMIAGVGNSLPAGAPITLDTLETLL